ncbi:MAG: NAD(+) synthase [Chloroflexota bacterium]|nr:NAD(+) synthase [Chloroflexota bacterium]
MANRLTGWIKEQVTIANRTGVVLGLSGGLDSAVVAALCKRAFPDSTLAAIMPCHSSDIDVAHAGLLAERFDIQTEFIDLGMVFDYLLTVLPGTASNVESDKLAQANIKPRLRMTTLYYLAAQHDSLVIGTGNRSEISIGYFTKYGDGGADIMPLGNLGKAQVRELARHMNVPREIIDKAPSGGLWEGQTDEREMGVTYEELDRYLSTGEARDEVKKRIDSLISGSTHKRALPPIPPF